MSERWAWLERQLVVQFDGDGVVLVTAVVAAVVGGLHALAPGHGKSIAAAYLVGADARVRDAVALGTIVAVMHTASVGALAVAWVTWSATAPFATETVTAWMQVAAAAIVVGVGVNLVRRAPRGHGHHHHGHGHGHRHHGHGHGQDGHGHGDLHVADGAVRVRPWSSRGVVALGTAGGLLPSPSAFLVLVTGLLTGRAAAAMVLVASFGLGMAVTLTGVGLSVLSGRSWLAGRAASDRRLSWVTDRLPALSAWGVVVGGGVYLAVSLVVAV